MWKPFKYNMKLVTFLLLIQMGYIVAKVIENPRSCNDSQENDPRLKRSDEKDIHFDLEDTTGIDSDDVATRNMIFKPSNENDNNHDITDNDHSNSKEFASNSKTQSQIVPIVNHVTKFPANVEKEDIVTDTLTIKNIPLQEPVYYKAIDPKYLIISRLSLPKPTKNITNLTKSEAPVNIDFKETTSTPLDYSNLTKATNVSNRDEANETVKNEVVINDADTDVSNIRELREHLLDHLLDYFLNIIKDEHYIRNDTRKRNGEDRMKVEEKLRNYYDPHHLEMLYVDDDDDYYDNNLDLSDSGGGNDSEEDLLDNFKQNKEVNKENITNIDPLNTLSDDVDKNTAKHTSPKDLQKEALNLEQNINSRIPDGESLNFNLSESSSESESVTSKYVNLIEKENDLSNALLNTTEKPEEDFDTNVNIITTTEISISNEASKDTAAETDTELLNYSEEAVTDGIEYVYDNGALTVDEYTSYEDYIDSEEFEVVKNATVHENEINPIVITTENGRRKNELDNEKYIANDILNANYNNANNSQLGNERTTSRDITSERDKPNKLAIIDLPNKNMNDNSSCNEDNLAESHLDKNLKQGIKRKLRNNKNCGKLGNKNKKSNKHNCRKSIILLNLNINLI